MTTTRKTQMEDLARTYEMIADGATREGAFDTAINYFHKADLIHEEERFNVLDFVEAYERSMKEDIELLNRSNEYEESHKAA